MPVTLKSRRANLSPERLKGGVLQNNLRIEGLTNAVFASISSDSDVIV